MPLPPDLRLLAEICSLPTAPFAEHAVIAFVTAFARRHKLHLAADPAGNLLLSSHAPATLKPGQPRLVLAAHMDHPGFVAARQEGSTLYADFRGGVLPDYLFTCPVVFATPGKPVRAKVVSVVGEPYPTGAVLQAGGRGARGGATGGATGGARGGVPPGTPGLFDLTPARFTRTNFYSRVCDDLAGVAAALAALRRLRQSQTPMPVSVLLTRAEEVGFIGALAAVHPPPSRPPSPPPSRPPSRPPSPPPSRPRHALLRKRDDLVLAIECSAEQPYARQHDGVILRVGDRTSIFNSSLTAFLTDTAQQLARTDPTFRFQRALMPGGTCESTVYDAWGYHAAAVCLALGNYHNMDRARRRIAPEHISLADYRNLIALCVALAQAAPTYRPGHAALKARLKQRYQALKHLLSPPTPIPLTPHTPASRKRNHR